MDSTTGYVGLGAHIRIFNTKHDYGTGRNTVKHPYYEALKKK